MLSYSSAESGNTDPQQMAQENEIKGGKTWFLRPQFDKTERAREKGKERGEKQNKNRRAKKGKTPVVPFS